MRALITIGFLTCAGVSLGVVSLAQAQTAPRGQAATSVYAECMTDEGYGRTSSCNGGGGGQ